MTEPSIGPDEPAHRPTGSGVAATVAPEGVAAVLAIVVVALLLTARLAAIGPTGPAPTPRPSDGPSPGSTSAGPVVDRVSINTVLGVNQFLGESGRSLQAELDKPRVDTANVKFTMVLMSQQLNLAGRPAATRLRDAPATALVGADLIAVYTQLSTEIDEANAFRSSDESHWRASARAVVETLKALEPIDLRLGALRAGLPDPAAPVASSVPPSSAPTDSAPPSGPSIPASPPTNPPTNPPTSPPTSPPTAPPTAPPSGVPTPTSTPPLAEPNQLQNPGFESGTDSWQLIRANPNVNANIVLDTTTFNSGKASARIDLTAVDGNPQTISLRQTGVTLEQGANYRVSIALQSTSNRQVRIRVISATPPEQSYVSKNLTAGSAWTIQTFDFSTAVGGSGRVFAIDLGLVGGTVWIDDVSIARVSPFAP